jgi:hypothetical protein
MARQLYASALRQPGAEARYDIHVREGLARAGHRNTPMFLDILDAITHHAPTAFVTDGLATWGRILPFYEDARFVELAQKHSHLLPLPNWHWNLQTALWAVREAARVEGDFVELGVFKGHTTLFLAEYLDFAAWPRIWRLYDTFSGIPDDQLDAGWAEINKAAYGGTFSYEEVRDRFAHFPNIRITRGRVPEVLLEDAPERIAFLHVDLNNSTAEIAALDVLFDRISPRGVILFDDYGWTVARAQHDAETKWFADRGLQILPLPTGQGLFIKS